MPTHDTQPRPLALVTGASSGIGRALAGDLASRGYDLLLVADEQAVHDVAQRLAPGHEQGAISTHALRADLTRGEDVQRVADEVATMGRTVEVLALNAGVAVSGPVSLTPLEEELRLVDLNCRSQVHLAKLLVPAMVEAGRGRVLVTSSIASAAANPYQASYGASKAFLRSWATALRHELAGTGVTVTTLMPGPTDTAIFEGGPIETTRIANGRMDRPEDVAREAVDGLLAGRASVVPGPWFNRVQVLAGSLLPDRLAAAATAFMTVPHPRGHMRER